MFLATVYTNIRCNHLNLLFLSGFGSDNAFDIALANVTTSWIMADMIVRLGPFLPHYVSSTMLHHDLLGL